MQGGCNYPAPSYYGGAKSLRDRRMGAGGGEKSQQCHKYFPPYSTFASEKPQFRTWERQTCFLLRVLANLVPPLPHNTRVHHPKNLQHQMKRVDMQCENENVRPIINSGQGRIQGAITPLKPTRVNIFAMILYNWQNSIRDLRPFCCPFVLSQQCCKVLFISHGVILTRNETWLPNISEITPPP